MEVFNNICKNNNLVLNCSNYVKSKGNDLIHFLVKNSRNKVCFNELKEYLEKHPDKVNIQNEKGWTPLMIASRFSNTTSTLETVECLLQLGADPDLKDNIRWTALMYASENSDTTSTFETVKLLLDYGADPNIKNEEWTALIIASVNSNTTSTFETVELLPEYSADPNIKDEDINYKQCITFFRNNPQLLDKYEISNKMYNKEQLISRISAILNSNEIYNKEKLISKIKENLIIIKLKI